MRTVLIGLIFGFAFVGVASAECPMSLTAEQLITCVNKEGAGVRFASPDNPDPRLATEADNVPGVEMASPDRRIDDPKSKVETRPAFADQ